MGREDHLRIGTAEREQAITALGEHFSAGRLEVDEYEQRCTLAAAARTHADLALIFDDLPAEEPEEPEDDLVVVGPRDPLIRQDRPGTAKLVFAGFAGLALVAVIVVVAITSTWALLVPIVLLGAILFMVS